MTKQIKRYGVYRVQKVNGSGKSQLIVPGELLLEEDEIEDALSKGKKLGGRTVTIRNADQRVMAQRLVAPHGKSGGPDDADDESVFGTGLGFVDSADMVVMRGVGGSGESSVGEAVVLRLEEDGGAE